MTLSDLEKRDAAQLFVGSPYLQTLYCMIVLLVKSTLFVACLIFTSGEVAHFHALNLCL